MSIFDSWGNFEAPCPHCGGVVAYWYFDADCRGNPSSRSVKCNACGFDFTKEPAGTAKRPCPTCGGKVEYEFGVPGPFSRDEPPRGRTFCRTCAENRPARKAKATMVPRQRTGKR